jgi:hypothetical protein
MPETAIRYAIYLAPRPDTALWEFGSAVLGYDAETGQDVYGFGLPSLPAAQWRHQTQRARSYGLHATLKAPFRLAVNTHEVQLVEALEDFALTRNAILNLPLVLRVLGPSDSAEEQAGGATPAVSGFLALVPVVASPAIAQLEDETVRRFDMFRAPLTDAEIARRNPSKLSQQQRRNLADFGYPYVLEDYRPHFTLSDRLDNAETLARELGEVMAAQTGEPEISLLDLVLFKQLSPTERFRVFARMPLRRGETA